MFEVRKMSQIKIKTDYITLGQLLKYGHIITDGGYAKQYLLNNKVFVNNELEIRRGRKIYPGMEIKIDQNIYLVVKNED